MAENNDDDDPRTAGVLDLGHAMEVTRVIRRHQRLALADEANAAAAGSSASQPQEQAVFPPGTAFGAAAALATAVGLWPVRRLVLRHVGHHQMPTFTNWIVSTIHACLAANAGLYAFGITGSRVYLEHLAHVPPTAPSDVTDAICADETVVELMRMMQQQQNQSKEEIHTHEFAGESSVGGGSGDINLSGGLSQANYGSTNVVSSSSSWDPRVSTMLALQRALQRCHDRRQEQQERAGEYGSSF